MHLFCTCRARYHELQDQLEELQRAFKHLEVDTLELNERTTRLFRRAKKRQEDLERAEEVPDGRSNAERINEAILERRRLHGVPELRQG